MKIIKDPATVKGTLVRITLMTVMVALLLTGAVLISEEVSSYRRTLIGTLVVQARILGDNSVSALMFNDRKAAEETLTAVRYAPQIEYAAIFTPDNSVFAHYVRNDVKENYTVPVSGCEEGVSAELQYMSFCLPIIFGKETPGKIYLRSDLNAFYRRTARHMITVLGVMTIAVGLSFLMISRMQRIITSPVKMLVDVMDSVSKTKDYSIRSSICHPHEFVILSDGFNLMLDQIQERDRALDQYQQHLEEQISARTEELASANRMLHKELIERRSVENALRQSEEQLRGIASAAQDAIIRVNESGRIIYWNNSAERIFGYPEFEAIGMELLKVVPGKYHDDLRTLWDIYQEAGSSCLMGKTFEAQAQMKDGREMPVEVSVSFIPVGVHLHVIGIVRDITERKEAEQTIQQMAFYDNLTGQPNRQLFKDRVEMAIRRAQREKDRLALLFLDLDKFKNINDTLGHSIGDALLVTSAERIASLIRKADTVSRHGGDEFMVLISHWDEVEDVARIAQKVLDSLSMPVIVEEHELFITASIGISLYPDDGVNFETLTKNADMAMYNAKEQGRNNFKFYTEAMNRRVTERSQLESELRKALERGELVLYYQPKVDIRNMSITGMEALLRWGSPDFGLITPSHFISLAEETGLIVQIGSWVLGRACSENKRLHEMGMGPLRVSVNVSARQFYQNDFVEQVMNALATAGLDSRWLEIEITETALMNDIPRSAEMLRRLSEHGVRVAIDDFGIGHSSLNYLKGLPVHTLKIDCSFIAEAFKSEDDAAIVETIITLARKLKLTTIAEGVETAEQLRFLQDRYCDEAQGFLFAHALPFDEFVMLVKEGLASPRPINI